MQSVSAQKYRLAAVANDRQVRVFAEPYLVDTITELFNLTSTQEYVILGNEAGQYKVVAIHQLWWLRAPDWNTSTPGEVAAGGVEDSQGFDTLDQAVVYLSSELNGAEVMYFTATQSKYLFRRIGKLREDKYPSDPVKTMFDFLLVWASAKYNEELSDE